MFAPIMSRNPSSLTATAHGWLAALLLVAGAISVEPPERLPLPSCDAPTWRLRTYGAVELPQPGRTRTYHWVVWSFAGILNTATPASVLFVGALSHAGVPSLPPPMASLSAYSSVHPAAS